MARGTASNPKRGPAPADPYSTRGGSTGANPNRGTDPTTDPLYPGAKTRYTPPSTLAKYTNEPGLSMDQLNAALLQDPQMQAFLAGLNQPQPEAQDPLSALLQQFSDAGSGSGGGSGYDLGGELNGIAAAYQARLDEMNRQRDAGNTEIGAARQAASDTITKRQADQAQVSTGINDSILLNYSKALEAQRAEAAKLASELGRFGVDPSRLAPMTTQQSGYLQQAQQAQSALSQRMQQIANESLGNRNSNMDLIAQGATGQLTNNYSAMRMQLDQQRAQQEAQARQQAAAAAARGGSSSDPISQATKYLQLQKLYNDVNGLDPTTAADYLKQNGQYDMGILDPNGGAFAAVNSGASNLDTVLRDYYTSDVPDGAGGTSKVFNDQAYQQAYQQLARSKASQQALAAQGWSPQRAAYRTATKAKTALKALTFKGR